MSNDETTRGLVLVVDDDSTIIEFVDMALSDDGFRCIGATNGEDAMQKVAESNLSLILLDISMPVMDGKEFCRWLHTHGHSDIPVIIMTAGQNAMRTCKDLGAQDCLAKPFDLSALQASVGKWARVRSSAASR